jgi:hypothetical protein
MRNDARPIGEDSTLKSGEGPHDVGSPAEGERPDGPESVPHERESHVVNREAEPERPDDPSGEVNS